MGGASISVVRLVPALEDLGWSVSFWTPSPSAIAEQLATLGHEVRGAPRPVAYSWAALRLDPGVIRRLVNLPGYLRAFRREVKRVKPTIVHANSRTTLAEAVVARSARVPVLFHIHEMLRPTRKSRLLRAAAHRVGTRVVGVSESCAAAMSDDRHEATIVREGADVPEWQAAPEQGLQEPVVASAGVISRRKGSDIFVEAARLALKSNPAITFRLIGSLSDPLDAEWGQGVIESALAAGIEYQERVEMSQEMPNWKIFVMPSREDPFPIVVLEAMAAGIPVIGARRDGIAEQLRGGAGVLVPPEDPASLAEQILALAADPPKRQAIGQKAREKVAGAYTTKHQVAALNQVYLEITEGTKQDPEAG